MSDALIHFFWILHGGALLALGTMLLTVIRPVSHLEIPRLFRHLAWFALLSGIASLLRHVEGDPTPRLVDGLEGVALLALLWFGLAMVAMARSGVMTPAMKAGVGLGGLAVLFALAAASPLVIAAVLLLLLLPGAGSAAWAMARHAPWLAADHAGHDDLRQAGWTLAWLIPLGIPLLFQLSSPWRELSLLGQSLLLLFLASRLHRSLHRFHLREIREIHGQVEEGHQALRFSEEKFRNLFAAALDPIFIADAQTGVIVDANPAAARLLALPVEEIVGHYLHRLLPEGDGREGLERLLGPRQEAAERFRGESPLLREDGARFFVEVSSSRFLLDRWELLETIFRDITRQKEAESALALARDGLDKAQEIAHVGSWDWHPVKEEFTCSRGLCRIFGEHAVTGPLSREAFLERIHPEDRARVEGAMASLLTAQEPRELEFRVIDRDGQERVVQEVAQVYRDGRGAPIRVVGMVRDITEQSRVEERLQLAMKIFENAFEAVMITDPQGVIQSVNPAFTLMTGYDGGEVVNKHVSFLRTDRQDPEFFQALLGRLRKDGRWQGEIWTRHFDGKASPQMLTITAIRDRFGTTRNYAAVFNDLTSLKKSEEKLLHESQHDALTGLPNRLLFKDRLEQVVAHTGRYGGRAAVMIFGLDGFKKVNDSLGYTWGDTLLKHLAMRFKATIRNVDTKSRLGGDEFGFVLPNIKDVQDMVAVVRKMVESMSLPFRIQGREIFLTASIGITLFPEDGDNAETLMRNANMAVDMAKKAGGNCYRFYTSAMSDQASKRLAMEERMRKALKNDEFVLFYQPKVSFESGHIVGAEALVRWIDPSVGMVSPAEFIPLAEETGLIIPLGEWVLRTACRQVQTWHKAGHPPLRVGVNLSPRQFGQKELTRQVEEIMAETGVAPELLELEITEGMMMNDLDNAIITLKKFRDMGVSIAVDDFGTGYSSLGYLKRFPINTLKIDRSFVRDLSNNSDDAAIVSAIISMSHKLGLQVVAEGVETREQWAFLRENQCDELQGFLFSRPQPVAEFVRLVEKREPFLPV